GEVSLFSIVDVRSTPHSTIDIDIQKYHFLDKAILSGFNSWERSNGRMNLENRRSSRKAKCLSGNVLCVRLISHLWLLLALALVTASTSAQERSKKDVLILNEVGLSHSLTDVMVQQIVG